MASSPNLNRLVASNQSVHGNTSDDKLTDKETRLVKSAIDQILCIVTESIGNTGSHTPQEFDDQLNIVTNLFRKKFEVIVLPVLELLAKNDPKIWDLARLKNSKLTPSEFANMSKGSANAREVALMSIYGITIEDIYQAQRIITKNQSQQ